MEAVFGILAVVAGVYCLVALVSTKRFANILDRTSKEYFSMKSIMPIGLLTLRLLMSAGVYKPGTLRDPKVYAKLLRLHGSRQIKYIATAYVADIIAHCVLAVLLCSLCAYATGEIELMLVVMLAAVAALPYMLATRLDDQLKKRQGAIKLEFPDFLSKFILLKGAGLEVQEAWYRAGESTNHASVLYREIQETNYEINNNMSMEQALMNFSIRCRDADVSRFVATVVQYITNGGGSLDLMLADQSSQSWKSRKQEALRLGQEASTKLSFTMMLMFVAIMVLIMAPVVMTMNAL